MKRRVHCFPRTPSGTLLFSHVVQYHRLMARTNMAATRQELFGNARVMASSRFGVLGGHLFESALAERYDSPSAVLRAHTLVPYYAAFMSPDAVAKWQHDVLWRNGKTFNRYLGKPSRPLFRNPMQMCLQCVEEDLKADGTTHWHVWHQMPGVSHCPRHWSPLVATCRHCNHPLADEFAWELPGLDCPACGKSLDRGDQAGPPDSIRRFIEISTRALTNAPPEFAPQTRRVESSRRLEALSIDISTPGGVARLERMVCDAWATDSLDTLTRQLQTPLDSSILVRTLNGGTAQSYPAAHIVLVVALDAVPAAEPASPIPSKDDAKIAIWLDEYPHPTRSRLVNMPAVMSRASDASRVALILVEHGLPAHLSLALISGTSLAQLRRHLGTSHKLIRSVRRQAGLGTLERSVGLPVRRAASPSNRDLEGARNDLRSFMAARNAPSRSELYREDPGLHNFLLRSDKEWFDQVLPSKSGRIGDVRKFDRQLARKLLKHVKAWRLAGSRRKPTINFACVLSGIRLEHYFALGRLPISAAVIAADQQKTNKGTVAPSVPAVAGLPSPLPYQASPSPEVRARKSRTTEQARAELGAFMQSCDSPSRNRLRSQGDGLYYYFAGHDRSYLDETLPAKHARGERRIADNARFDSEFAERLRAYRKQPTMGGLPQRLTRNFANRLAGYRLDYYLAAGKLPLTKELIDSASPIEELHGPPCPPGWAATAQKRPGRERHIADPVRFDSDFSELLSAYRRQPAMNARPQRISCNLANRLAGFRLDHYLAAGKLPRIQALIDAALPVEELVGPPCRPSGVGSGTVAWDSIGARNALATFIENVPFPSREKLRAHDRRLYDFLMACEPRELDQLLPAATHVGPRRILDLERFDRELAQKVRWHAGNDATPSRGPSVHLVNRIAGFRLDFYFRRGLLPLTSALIANHLLHPEGTEERTRSSQATDPNEFLSTIRIASTPS